jgi:hypothetical protein
VTLKGPGYGTITNCSGGSTTGIDGPTFGNGVAYVSLNGFTITNWRNATGSIGTANHFQITNNTITYNGGNSFGAFNSGGMPSYYELSNNAVSYDAQLWYGTNKACYGWPLSFTAWGNHVSVFGNTVGFSTGEAMGLSGQYGWVYNNTISNFQAAGIYCQECSEAVIEDNFVWNDVADNGTWFGNAITQSSSKVGILIANEDSSSNTGTAYTFLSDVTIRNNIVYDAGLALAYENFKVGNPMQHFRIENNTLAGGGTGSTNILTMDASATGGSNSDVFVVNNIFWWSQAGGSNGTTSSTGISYEYNEGYNVPVISPPGTGNLPNSNPNFHG